MAIGPMCIRHPNVRVGWEIRKERQPSRRDWQGACVGSRRVMLRGHTDDGGTAEPGAGVDAAAAAAVAGRARPSDAAAGTGPGGAANTGIEGSPSNARISLRAANA